MRVLFLTNMYPTSGEPWFGSFVKELADGLENIGVEVEVLQFDGRRDRWNYLRACTATRARVRLRRFDLVHAHYGLSGGVAMAQHRVPVITTFWGCDTCFPRWHRSISWIVAR